MTKSKSKTKIATRNLDPASKADRRIAMEVDQAVAMANKLYSGKIIKETKLEKAQVRKLLRAVRKKVLVDLDITLRPIKPGNDDGVAAQDWSCGSHLTDCGPYESCPTLGVGCGEDSWWPGCDDRADMPCPSEVCSDGFMCAGSHSCTQNICTDNACHSEVFSCQAYEIETPAPCLIDEPETNCIIDEPDNCIIDEPDDQCIIDQPDDACPGEDEGSDGIMATRQALANMFASPVWQDVIRDIAVDGADLEKRMSSTTITVAEDLFDA